MQEQFDQGSIVLWSALRHLQALRESLGWTLDGEFHFRHDGRPKRLNKDTVNDWLESQGCGQGAASVSSAIENHRIALLGRDALNALTAAQRTRYGDTDDWGHERSGAGWMHAANFCITSAFVRLLGAWEQYELDVLKALFYYRPMGKQSGPDQEKILQEVDEAVIREVPVRNGNREEYAKPPLWTWIRSSAENNVQRHMIFAKVFDVEAVSKADEGTKRRDAWYEKRNAIAHGRSQVIMPLAEFVEADVFVYRSMRNVADQVRAKHHLVL